MYIFVNLCSCWTGFLLEGAKGEYPFPACCFSLCVYSSLFPTTCVCVLLLFVLLLCIYNSPPPFPGCLAPSPVLGLFYLLWEPKGHAGFARLGTPAVAANHKIQKLEWANCKGRWVHLTSRWQATPTDITLLQNCWKYTKDLTTFCMYYTGTDYFDHFQKCNSSYRNPRKTVQGRYLPDLFAFFPSPSSTPLLHFNSWMGGGLKW